MKRIENSRLIEQYDCCFLLQVHNVSSSHTKVAGTGGVVGPDLLVKMSNRNVPFSTSLVGIIV